MSKLFRVEDILSDDTLLTEEPLDFVDESEPAENKYECFKWAHYDWSQFDPVEAGYAVIRLIGDETNRRRKSKYSGVYFTVVDLYHYPILTENDQHWYPLVEHYRDDQGEYTNEIKRIVAHRNVGPRKGRRVEYMHRTVGKINEDMIRDHINGYPLDNRSINLRSVSVSINNHNIPRPRTSHTILRPGVEWVSRAQTMVRGVVQLEGTKTRSKETWSVDEQLQAQRWYINTLKEAHGCNVRMKVPLPSFPPRLSTCHRNVEEESLIATF